jgi:hypothetical protein
VVPGTVRAEHMVAFDATVAGPSGAGGRWLRWQVTELELWIGVHACPAPSLS